MRRLWAHILIACAALVAVFASFPSLIKGVSSSGDHETRRQFTFQLTERETNENETATQLDKSSAKRMAKVMEQRLINYGVTSYEITTSGDNAIDDIVTVSFTADSNNQYNQIVTYLTFDGSFALMNKLTDVVTASQFKRGSAYQKSASVNEYPTVILPIKTDYDEWRTLVQGAIDNPFTTEATEEGGEATSEAKVFLIYNYEEGDTYELLEERNKLQEKTLLTFSFDPSDESKLYYDSNKNSLSQTCYYQDSNGNGFADPTEVKEAYNQASYLLNLFNASSLEYDVKCIKGLASGTEVWLAPAVEKITSEGQIVWNATLTATLAAVIITSLLLVFFYRLGALSIVTTSVTSVFGAIIFMVLAGLEYNMLAVAAFVLVGIISMTSGAIYMNKLKEDSYRGHTLKKANTEASKKSLLPIIDIHIVSVIIGLMTYLLGGAALHSFGSILIFGSIVSVIINTLGLKGLMWLSTNTTALSGKYEVFGINSENVPNHLAEEKQKYYGPYADKDLTAKKKPVGIGAIVCLLIGVVGLSLGAALKGSIISPKVSSKVASEIYVQNKIEVKDEDSKSELNETSLENEILSVIMVESKKKDGTIENKKLLDFVTSTEYVHYTTTSSETTDENTTNYLTTYYVVKLDQTRISLNSNASYKTLSGSLQTVLEGFFEESDLFNTSKENSITFKNTVTYVNEASPDWTKIILSTSIAVLILTVYLMIRYRLSRGLATLIFPVAGGVITLGILGLISLTGLAMPAATVVALPISVMFSYLFMILYMNREREMILDDKSRDISLEHRKELSVKALGIAYTSIFDVSVLGIYLLINFFGFGVTGFHNIYLISILGSAIALLLVTVLYVPVSNWLMKLFKGINFKWLPKPKKNKKAVVKKSAEPEEAIFIGIND